MDKLKQGMLALAMLATTTTGIGCGMEGDADIEALEGELIVAPGTPFYEQFNQVDAGGQKMLGCYPGFAMSGYQPVVYDYLLRPLNRETIKCVPFTPDPARPGIFLDTATQRDVWQVPLPTKSGGHTVMHTCELGQVMIGFHASKNLLACAWPKPGTSPFVEVLDLNTQDPLMPPAGSNAVPPGKRMHTCPSTRVMNGIHLGKNQWSCGTDAYPL
jgi:hypothetical protein